MRKLILLVVVSGLGVSQTIIGPRVPTTTTFASPPSSPATGAVYLFTDASSAGACTGSGSALSYCRWNGANWIVTSGSGGGSASSVFTGSTATNPSFSATPTFSLADVSVKSPVRIEPGALTANVTAVTFTNKSAGAKFSIAWTQDGTGGRTVAYGASASNTCTIDPTLSITTTQNFEVAADGSTVVGTGCTTNHDGIEGGAEAAAPGTPTASNWFCWTDSTSHNRSCKSNNSATIYHMMSVLPDTAPGAGQLPVGNAGGTAYAPVTVSGDGTLASTGALTVTKVNSAVVPISASIVGTNGSNQLIAGTGHSVAAILVCPTSSASGTAEVCNTSPTFTPAAGDTIIFQADIANTGAFTLNVNSLGAKAVTKRGTTALVAGDIAASPFTVILTYDGTQWEMQGQGARPVAYTDTDILATGIVSGLAAIEIYTGSAPCPTGTHCAFGTTYKGGYAYFQSTATDHNYIDLPTAAAGLQWCVKNSVVSGTGAAVTGVITVKAQTGDYINNDGTIGSSGGVLSSAGAAGDGACFVASAANHWEAFIGKGTWAP